MYVDTAMTAILSVWIALGSLLTTIFVVLNIDASAEIVLTLLPWTYALACTLAAAQLWGLRKRRADEPGVGPRRLQAVVAIGLCAIALTILLVAANGPLYGLAGLAIEIGFLAFCYWGYRRVVLREP